MMACFLVWSMNSTAMFFGANFNGACVAELGVQTYVLASLILIKSILSSIVTLNLMTQVFRTHNRRLETFRVTLWRVVFVTRTSNSKVMYTLLLVSDLLTVACFIICLPMRPNVSHSCMGFYEIFLLMTFVYQFIVFVRLPLMLCLFMFGKPIWRWIKRLPCCACLGAVEYERRVSFEIYDAQQYVVKVNKEITHNKFRNNRSSNFNDGADQEELDCSGSKILPSQVSDSSNTNNNNLLKEELKFEDLTCAICLDDFVVKKDTTDDDEKQCSTTLGKAAGQVVALKCNESHTFHAPCLKEWLDRSPDCPLCKANVFTSQIEADKCLKEQEDEENMTSTTNSLT